MQTVTERAIRRPRSRRRSPSGQSLVEFALVFPILLILLLTIVDFGRIFSAGITVESAARTAAETAAGQYLTEMTRVSPAAIDTAGYQRIHDAAWQSICDEASSLPNATAGSGGSQCGGLPTVVCVHDNTDPLCGSDYNDAGGIPAGCPSIAVASRPSNSQVGESGSQTWPYVEVRVCYRFSSVLQMQIPFIGGTLSPIGGDFFIEKTRVFDVTNY
ncbi:MAG TPA: TadE family protein [Candidatus Limnocylindrales bacterium]|nr:TadE family protein [Candidatus Limnocylindrales bacterium]